MASEPDDYQTISDNCPGYMVLISEGIVCTRCAGEKRHKANECPKPATAAHLATEDIPGADEDGDGMDNGDSEMESLSDTESLSSESTARSESSEMRTTDAHRSDQGGNRPQDTHLSKRGFMRPDASHTSTQPDRTSLSPPNHRAAREPRRVTQTANTNGHTSNPASNNTEAQSRDDRGIMYGPKSPQSTETYSFSRSATTVFPPRLPSNNKHASSEEWNGRTRKRGHAHGDTMQQAMNHEAIEDRLLSKSLVDTTGKFDYSDTTCPSSFGFGRLPSEAMG